MLTSPRKVCKLFIKFVVWCKFTKAEALLLHYPECGIIIPWQKAFEEASMQNSYNACKWIYNKSQELNFALDIHFHNDEIIKYLYPLTA